MLEKAKFVDAFCGKNQLEEWSVIAGNYSRYAKREKSRLGRKPDLHTVI